MSSFSTTSWLSMVIITPFANRLILLILLLLLADYLPTGLYRDLMVYMDIEEPLNGSKQCTLEVLVDEV
jgi:hypothetical protein